MSFRDGLVGFVAGLIVGLGMSLGIVGLGSTGIISIVLTDTMLFIAATGVVFGLLGIISVYYHYQQWTSECTTHLRYHDREAFSRFAVDAFAMKEFRCDDPLARPLIFLPLQPSAFILNGIVTPIERSVDKVSIHFEGDTAIVTGPRAHQVIIREIARQLEARSA